MLVVACATNVFYIFNVEEKRFSEWSQEVGLPAFSSFPKDVTVRPEYPFKIIFNPTVAAQFLIVANNHFVMVDLDRAIPKNVNFVPVNCVGAKQQNKRLSKEGGEGGGGKGGKGGKGRKNTNSNFSVVMKYQNIILADFLAPGELVVVEHPWSGGHLVAVKDRHLYGS